jgi:multidrug efflux system membrane fusion protein
VKDGDQLKAGDKILQIRNEALAKRVAHMEQALESAKLQYKSADELSKRKLGSELNLENAALALKAAEADLTSARTTFDNSIFMAPFDGIIDNISVKEGDLVANFGAGHSTIGRFINLESVEARAYLSQYERNEIYESEEAIIIKNDDEQISAKITFIAKSANPNTGTFLVKAVGENAIKIVDGEAISLKIKVGDVQSHNVPISAVILDKSGDLSIKILEKNNQVKEVKINLVDEDDKGVWIAGLPQQCKIILAG